MSNEINARTIKTERYTELIIAVGHRHHSISIANDSKRSEIVSSLVHLTRQIERDHLIHD